MSDTKQSSGGGTPAVSKPKAAAVAAWGGSGGTGVGDVADVYGIGTGAGGSFCNTVTQLPARRATGEAEQGAAKAPAKAGAPGQHKDP